MLSSVVELILDRALADGDAFIDVKPLTVAHPKAKQGAKTMSKGKVLVTGSNATRIEVQGSGWGPTGNYLNETVVPIMALISAGYRSGSRLISGSVVGRGSRGEVPDGRNFIVRN